MNHIPTIQVLDREVWHDQACAVYHTQLAHYDLDRNIFQPCDIARSQGWRLVQAKSKFQRLVLKWVFGER